MNGKLNNIYSLIKTIRYNELWKISIFADFISTN